MPGNRAFPDRGRFKVRSREIECRVVASKAAFIFTLVDHPEKIPCGGEREIDRLTATGLNRDFFVLAEKQPAAPVHGRFRVKAFGDFRSNHCCCCLILRFGRKARAGREQAKNGEQDSRNDSDRDGHFGKRKGLLAT